MKRIFLVTGYPRSRTAWLSAFLSSGRTLCLHEPIVRFDRKFEPMVEFVEQLPHENIGIADSAIPALRAMFSVVYRDCPVLVVERDKAEALASHLAYFGFRDGRTEKAFDDAERGLQALEEHFTTVKRISFESLNSENGMRAAWDACCAGEPFDEFRARAMGWVLCNPKY